MKNVLVLLGLVFSVTMFAQKEEKAKTIVPPAIVKEMFAKEFPMVKKVKWEKEDANYEAGFDLNKVETSVLIDAKGKILETESEINVATLSKKITDYVATNYPKQKIKGAAKIINAAKKVTYEAEIKGFDLIFDENGTFIKATKD